MRELSPHINNFHIGNHIHFPPGYPFIVGIESIFFKSYEAIRKFEWIILSSINSFLLLSICWKVSKERKYIGVILSFLSPIFIYGIGTINLGSELWFMCFSLIGISQCFKFSRNDKLIYLFLANIFFSISYLIRPEGILFLSSSFIATFFYLKKIINNNHKTFKQINFEIFLIAFSFLIPFLIFILPYIFYLYKELGIIALTGKGLDWSELNSVKNSGIITNLINNFLGLVDVVFSSTFFLGFSFFLFSTLVLISFLFIKRTKRVANIKRKINDLLILTSPLPFCTYVYLKNMPLAR